MCFFLIHLLGLCLCVCSPQWLLLNALVRTVVLQCSFASYSPQLFVWIKEVDYISFDVSVHVCAYFPFNWMLNLFIQQSGANSNINAEQSRCKSGNSSYMQPPQQYLNTNQPTKWGWKNKLHNNRYYKNLSKNNTNKRKIAFAITSDAKK